MPFKSEAQRRWMWANDKEMAKQWEDHTPDKKLPKKFLNRNLIVNYTGILKRTENNLNRYAVCSRVPV